VENNNQVPEGRPSFETDSMFGRLFFMAREMGAIVVVDSGKTTENRSRKETARSMAGKQFDPAWSRELT
jgi:hypothetical protein